MGGAPEEFESQLNEYFDNYADEEGLIDQSGFIEVLRCLNQEPNDDDVQKIFQDHDADGNQKLDKEEFKTWMEGMWKSLDDVIQGFALSFKTISQGADKITVAAFIDTLTNKGESRFSEEEAQSIVNEINTIREEDEEEEHISMKELINYIYGREPTEVAEENTQEEQEDDNQEQAEPEENVDDKQEQAEPEQEEADQNQEQGETEDQENTEENQEQGETTENQEGDTAENREEAGETTEPQEETVGNQEDSGNQEQTESEQQQQGETEKTESGDQEQSESVAQQSAET